MSEQADPESDTGGAGVEVPLTLVRERSRRHLRLRSIDRESLLRRPSRH